MTLTLVQQGTLGLNGRVVTSEIELPAYPLRHPTTNLSLAAVCVVVEHTEHNGPWQLAYPTCHYPHDMVMDDYYSPEADPLRIYVSVQSSFFPGVWLSKYQALPRGRIFIDNDEEIVLVDQNTPKLFGAGAAIVAVGVALLVFFACYVQPVAPDARPPWEPQVAVEMKNGVA